MRTQSLEEFQAEVGVWAEKKFPAPDPPTNYTGVASHLIEEAEEFHSAARDHLNMMATVEEIDEEAGGCLLLLLSYAHRRGISLLDIGRREFERIREAEWDDGGQRGYAKRIRPNPMAGMIDNRSPVQIETDGDDYWPDDEPGRGGTLYTPSQHKPEEFWPADKPRRRAVEREGG